MNQEFARRVQALVDNIRQAIVTSPDVIKMSLLGLLCQGHVLLDDFPGVGKTLLAKAQSLSPLNRGVILGQGERRPWSTASRSRPAWPSFALILDTL